MALGLPVGYHVKKEKQKFNYNTNGQDWIQTSEQESYIELKKNYLQKTDFPYLVK